jgi:hypothetical protein
MKRNALAGDDAKARWRQVCNVLRERLLDVLC